MNAFTGHIVNHTRISDIQSFRSPLYSRWVCAVRDSSKTPDWPTYRAKHEVLAKPESAEYKLTAGKQMGQLSQRAQHIVALKVSISIANAKDEQAGKVKQSKLKKAAI